MKSVIALGGNALRKRGEGFDYETHLENAKITFRYILESGLISGDNSVVITHGNGPQVGMEFMRHFLTKERYPMYPLHALTASTQGWIGYILEQALRSVLREKGLNRDVATLITLIGVSPEDPALKNPDKPIGEFMDQKEAQELSILTGLPTKEDAGRGWRLVVGSPKPLKVENSHIINSLAERGVLVIALGGGGIPVDGRYSGVPAVVDKDKASALLALGIGANALYILTQVPHVYTDYGTERQKEIRRISVEEVLALMEEGHFAAGSMLPKIEAAVEFLKGGGEMVVITSPDHLPDAVRGKAGTLILP